MGRIYNPDDNIKFGFRFGANPIGVHIDDNIYRIFFNCRDKGNRAYVTSLDYDLSRQTIIESPRTIIVSPSSNDLLMQASQST